MALPVWITCVLSRANAAIFFDKSGTVSRPSFKAFRFSRTEKFQEQTLRFLRVLSRTVLVVHFGSMRAMDLLRCLGDHCFIQLVGPDILCGGHDGSAEAQLRSPPRPQPP